ncbi:Ger(x)C family spore germination protein [Salsuginibacillus kocurii]|uniref:Ger(x)C family spore germination protein n=1 Tax=Salsuginibacillus kocurii TaxID=427078 RepID=UPI00037B225E|nr:Ger(x)C family spore germination protein [Salsuginibacillus kocurii]
MSSSREPTSRLKPLFLLLMCCSLLLLSACWDRVEVNDIVFVLGAGLHETEDGMIELSIEMVLPQQEVGADAEADSELSTYVEAAEGRTIMDAIANLQQKVPRELFWGQMSTTIISESLAESGMQRAMDFLARHPGARLRKHIFITQEDPVEIFSTAPHLEQSASDTMKELARMQLGIEVDILELLKAMDEESIDIAVPLIETTPIGQGKNEKQDLQINGAAIIKQGHMTNTINMKATRGVLWLKDEVEETIVTISPEDVEGRLTMKMAQSSTSFTPEIHNGKWRLHIYAKSEDDIFENASHLDPGDPDTIAMLEQELAAEIKERMELALQIIQKDIQADVFHFGEIFRRHYPDQWKEAKLHWDEIYPEIEVNIEVETTVNRPGMTVEPIGIPKGEVEE